MEAIKGMIALLLAAIVVFAAVVFYNSKTEPAYEARIIRANMADTVKTLKPVAIKKQPAAAAHQKNKNSSL